MWVRHDELLWAHLHLITCMRLHACMHLASDASPATHSEKNNSLRHSFTRIEMCVLVRRLVRYSVFLFVPEKIAAFYIKLLPPIYCKLSDSLIANLNCLRTLSTIFFLALPLELIRWNIFIAKRGVPDCARAEMSEWTKKVQWYKFHGGQFGNLAPYSLLHYLALRR